MDESSILKLFFSKKNAINLKKKKDNSDIHMFEFKQHLRLQKMIKYRNKATSSL